MLSFDEDESLQVVKLEELSKSDVLELFNMNTVILLMFKYKFREINEDERANHQIDLIDLDEFFR
jgi:hypothetical protein